MTSPCKPNGYLPGCADNQEPKPSRPPCKVCRHAARAGDKWCPECGRQLCTPPEAEPPASADEADPPPKAEPPAQPEDQPPHEAPAQPPAAPAEPEAENKPSPPAPGPKTCSCGQVLPPDARFCMGCGAQVGTPKSHRRLVRKKSGSPESAVEMKNGELTVGKTPDSNLTVTGDDYVSRRHARLYEDNGMVFLEDLGSSNGTFLRVRRPVVLEPGDEVLVGTTVLRFEQD